ncbi:trypsin-like serine protease [Xenorhabdus littoralis]|uniref:trypsin-like serine protease n=1 Tax=Xenorhabdus littoralis TaxID=2582835 RepID=UPI0029E8193B|nr:trypsin-like serine protease [Xenorhabdus sp. psl]MDX7989840.1 trypsin-like serine protease [Xenorhabdus sp. psl]
MIVYKMIFIFFILFYCNQSFSDSVSTLPPLETIAGGEESCSDTGVNKCKPWVVGIYYADEKNQESLICSGSLIAKNYVLTAAHCKIDNIKKYIIKNHDKTKVSTALLEGFNLNNVGYDFALMRLEKEILLENENDYGRVRRFFHYDEAYEKLDKDYYQSSIYGYGLLGIDPKTGQEIKNKGVQRRADVKIFTTAIDTRSQQGLMLEASKNKNSTPGIPQKADSGGPIIWKDTIVGVTSWGLDTLKIKNSNDYPFFFASDVTKKYTNTGLSKKIDHGFWFSNVMKKIWIDNPDWDAHLSKRGKNILIEGWGRKNSKIEVSYSIGHELIKSKECDVLYTGRWRCSIPNKNIFIEGLNKMEDHKVIITANEVNNKDKAWESDTVQAKIPSISKEFGIIYPGDNSIILTKNFIVRGYADPGSDVELIFQSDLGNGISYAQDKLCEEIRGDELIKTESYGLWSCTIKNEFINEIKNDEVKFKISARQSTGDINLYDQVDIIFKPQEYTRLSFKKNQEDKTYIYRKKIKYDVSYAKEANTVCIFGFDSFDCKNNPYDEKEFYLMNVKSKGDKTNITRAYIGAIQKIENADSLDKKLWYDDELLFEWGYIEPTFINLMGDKNIVTILSTDPDDKKLFSGIGGDDRRYSDANGDIILPSEYSIYMKEKNGENYVKILLGNGKDFDEIPIIYKNHDGKGNFPTWSISLPSTLKDGLYYIEVTDKYHPSGLTNIKNTWYSILKRAYFQIETPKVKITAPSVGEKHTIGSPSFISGSSNVPGDEVIAKKRKIDSSSELQESNQNLSKETVICTGAMVSDNGNWQCGKPIIFPVGNYELTAELIKEGKIVATDVTHLTIKDKNNDEPEKKKFEINNPKNNSTVDPDNPITISGTLSGPAGGGGGGGGGFGGFLSGLFGAIFGVIEGIASLFSGMLGFFWEFVIHPGDIFGGDTYTMELQETQNGVNVGDPIKWTFTVPMRITEPKSDAQYRLDDGISIKGQGSPGQLVFVSASEYFLPPDKIAGIISNEGIICETTIDEKGKWSCPDNPVLTANNEGLFSLYAAQYKKTGTAQLGQLGDTYERTSQVTRKYEVTKTKIKITNPDHGTKITKLPFMISGTGEKGAQVYIKGFGGTDDCNTTIDTSSDQWSCGPYQPEEGKYTISAEQFIDNQLNSSVQVSFEVQTQTVKPVVITQPHNGEIYQRLDNVLPKGTGEPGTTVCLDKKVLSQVCKSGVTVDEQGNWEWSYGLDTSVKGEYKLVATAFLDNIRQSTAKITFDVAPDAGETKLAVTSPKEDEVIQTPSYTFSGTMPSDAKNITVKAFGGHNDCSAKLNREDYTWTCGPYSSVPGDYDVVVVDDAGSQINRSFKVRYGANLQMSILSPTEGEQIDKYSYLIRGKGQAGARITVNDAVACDVLVDENQNWVCPYSYKSIIGAQKLLGQQWVDGVPSGKPITRNYEVIYGMSDITIDPISNAVCTSTNLDKAISKDTQIMKSGGTISASVTGIATKGFYVSLKAKNDNKNVWQCGPVQASEKDGKWSCHVDTLGVYQVEATQSLTQGGHAIGNITKNKVNITGGITITNPAPGWMVRSEDYPFLNIQVSGFAQPGVTVKNKQDSVQAVANNQGWWRFWVHRGRQGHDVSVGVFAPFCGREAYFESNFTYMAGLSVHM